MTSRCRSPSRHPGLDGGDLAVGKHIDDVVPLQIADDGAVAMPALPCPVVDAGQARRRPRRRRPCPDGPQRRTRLGRAAGRSTQPEQVAPRSRVRRCDEASFAWLPSWTGSPAGCWPGASRTRWRRTVSRRGAERGGPPLRRARDHEYRPGLAVYVLRLDRPAEAVGYPDLDGRQRALRRQDLHRAPLGRSLKYECVHLRAWETGSQAKAGLGRWISSRNHQRPRAAHGGQPPAVVCPNRVEADRQGWRTA